MKPEIIFVAADFVVDPHGKLFFIELNNFPSISPEYRDAIGDYQPLEGLKRLVDPKSIILIYNAKKWRESTTLKNLYKAFVEVFGDSCELNIWSKKTGEGFSIDNLRNKKGIVYTPNPDIREMFFGHSDYKIINPKWVRDLCRDKRKVYKILSKKMPNNIPQTFEFTNKKGLAELIKSTNFDQAVVKPRYGSKGNGVNILENPLTALSIDLSGRDHWLYQQKIDNFDRVRQKYYDVRVYLLNGDPVGVMSRVSDNPVVNISLGGHIEKVDEKLKRQVSNLAQKIYQLVFLTNQSST